MRRDPALDFRAEMLDQALDRPGGRIAECTDGVSLNLARHLLQRVNFVNFGVATNKALHHPPHPAGALAARCALTTALMLVEIGQARNGLHHVGALVHDDDARRAKTGSGLFQRIKIHGDGVADRLRHHRGRGPARDHRQQIVPAATHTAGMLFDQLAKRNAHFLFDIAGIVHMAGDAEQLGACVAILAETGEPVGAAPQDRRHDGDGFDIVDRGRAAIEAGARRKWRLQARLALLAFQRLDQRGFLATDIGTCPAVKIDVELPARFGGIVAKKAGGISFVDGGLKAARLVHEFTTDIDIGGMCPHRETGDHTAFQQLVRLVPDDIAVLACAGFGLIGINHKIVGTRADFLGHEGPFQAGRETCTAAATKA